MVTSGVPVTTVCTPESSETTVWSKPSELIAATMASGCGHVGSDSGSSTVTTKAPGTAPSTTVTLEPSTPLMPCAAKASRTACSTSPTCCNSRAARRSSRNAVAEALGGTVPPDSPGEIPGEASADKSSSAAVHIQSGLKSAVRWESAESVLRAPRWQRARAPWDRSSPPGSRQAVGLREELEFTTSVYENITNRDSS